eukprot:5239699-Pleurochrysis_carterae.AAC.2
MISASCVRHRERERAVKDKFKLEGTLIGQIMGVKASRRAARSHARALHTDAHAHAHAHAHARTCTCTHVWLHMNKLAHARTRKDAHARTCAYRARAHAVLWLACLGESAAALAQAEEPVNDEGSRRSDVQQDPFSKEAIAPKNAAANGGANGDGDGGDDGDGDGGGGGDYKADAQFGAQKKNEAVSEFAMTKTIAEQRQFLPIYGCR